MGRRLVELKGLLRTKEINYSIFAREVGMSPSSFSHKINGKSSFTCKEVDLIVRKLGLGKVDIPFYFF